MNPIRSLLLILVASSALVAAGCKDSPTSSDTDTGDRSQLIVKSWKTVTIIVNGFDASSTYADLTTFMGDGTYTATFPSSSPKQGTWQLTDNDTQLTMDAGTNTEGVWTIIELTSTKLHMTSKLNVLGSIVDVDYTGVPN